MYFNIASKHNAAENLETGIYHYVLMQCLWYISNNTRSDTTHVSPFKLNLAC